MANNAQENWRLAAPSIRATLVLAVTAALSVILAAAAVIAWTASAAETKLNRAKASYEQLNLVTRLEAEIGRLLLAEVSGIVSPMSSIGRPGSLDEGQRTITTLIDSIGAEIDSLSDDNERAKEREEFKTAFAIRALFNDMQHGIERERSRVSHLDSGSAVRDFMANVVPSFEKLNAIVGGVVADERGEAADVLESLVQLRQTMLKSSIVTVLLAASVALVGAALTYRMLMRPLDALAHGSELLARGQLAYRVPIDGPPELARLALLFNEMAGRIAAQKAELLSANECLEAAVAERTRALEVKASQLADVDKTRRLFYAKMGHELKTPLTAILGEADVALRRKNATADDLSEALRHIAANGQFLNRRISNLLAVARSEDGRLALEPAPCDLVAIGKASVEQAQAFSLSRDVKLQLDAASAAAAPALADHDWIAQALLALIDNAVKFAPAHSTVRVMVSATDEGMSEFRVRDEGRGVAEDDLEHLFEPYFRSGQGRHHAGTGLGLSVAKWVAEQHGGTISAHNLDPHGFEIRIRLPRP